MEIFAGELVDHDGKALTFGSPRRPGSLQMSTRLCCRQRGREAAPRRRPRSREAAKRQRSALPRVLVTEMPGEMMTGPGQGVCPSGQDNLQPGPRRSNSYCADRRSGDGPLGFETSGFPKIRGQLDIGRSWLDMALEQAAWGMGRRRAFVSRRAWEWI